MFWKNRGTTGEMPVIKQVEKVDSYVMLPVLLKYVYVHTHTRLEEICQNNVRRNTPK